MNNKAMSFCFAVAGLLTCCLLLPARAQGAYVQRIVAPEREDTPQRPDTLLGPAIKDLRGALKQMTGLEYSEARGDKEYTGAGIFIVRSQSAGAPADAVQKLKGKGREPFIIRSRDDKNLWIIANGEDGLSHGIYFFLEQLGCHWFMPNDNWTVIPKRANVALKIDRLVEPAFKLRDFFGTGGFGPESVYDPKYDARGRLQFRIRTEDWKRRNRFGGEFSLDGHAGEDFNLRHKETLIAHPEYLAEVNGKRVWSETAKHDASNPDAVKLWVDDRLAAYRAKRKAAPDTAWSFAVSVDPADGGGFCECANCRKQFAAHGENDATFYSNQVFHMSNEVAKAVRREFPDGFVNVYAYADHSAPPSFPVEPNVYISIIPYGFNYSGLQPDEFIRAWGRKTGRLSLYDYWSIPDWSWDHPSFNYLSTAKDKIGFWNANNVEGFSSESTYGAGAMGIGWYLSSRLLWDPKANQDAVLNAFYTKSFGAAAPPMKRMMERWAQNFLLSSHELATAFRDLQEAQKLAGGDTAIQARIDDMAKYVQYLRLHHEYSVAPDAPKRLEANKKLVEHLFDIYDTNIVHSFRIYQFLVDYGRNKEVYAEFDQHDPKAPGWKRVAPLSHEDVSTLIADGIKDYQPLDFVMKGYSGKLVRLQPNAAFTPKTGEDKWTPLMQTRGALDVELLAPANLKRLPLRVSHYYDQTVTVVDANGKEIFTQKVIGTKEQGKFVEMEMAIPGPGFYKILFRPVAGGGFGFHTLSGVPLIMRTFISEMGGPSPRLYFYVPRGLKTIALWYPLGDFQNQFPPLIRNPDDQKVTIERHDDGKIMLIAVPPGMDGKVWSLDGSRSPNEPHRMLNVPAAFSFSPETLMVPEDALR